MTRASQKWLLAAAHIGPDTRAARLAIAALRDPYNHQIHKDGEAWLREVAGGEGQRAVWAAEILEEVA
jgi:hypothetical protein